uniref:Wall-associated receptor kinase galacturonan-binding domain-containing protein n=1 Tax=Aegilops tauschii subsp. strangulata TaxID=200361 RepID=A0A453T2B2_AEGTS
DASVSPRPKYSAVKMKLPEALRFVLALLLLRPATTVGLQRSQEANRVVPSTATLADCPRSCGNLSIDYPFGIGSGCSRQPDFDLRCVENSSAQAAAPRLFLQDGVTEIISDVSGTDQNTDFLAAFSHVISLRSDADVYNISWFPGKSFLFLPVIILNITGCNFDAYMLERSSNTMVGSCTVTCPTEGITDAVARQTCNGTGCCSVVIENMVTSLQFRFVRRRIGKLKLEGKSTRGLLWDTINITSDHAALSWVIRDDQQSSAGSLQNRSDYACRSNHSGYTQSNELSFLGYLCFCDSGYQGNPYILDGCSRDRGFDPYQRRNNCSRMCGNISVPFPFGIEYGCFGRKLFQLNCTNPTTSTLQFNSDLDATPL